MKNHRLEDGVLFILFEFEIDGRMSNVGECGVVGGCACGL